MGIKGGAKESIFREFGTILTGKIVQHAVSKNKPSKNS
jgi:hypothetical protein